MERHRLFRLNVPVSLMGMEIDDWLVLVGGWILILQAAALVMGPRPRLVVATFVAGTCFLLYRRLKDRLPRYFFKHLMGYLTEAETYRVTPDDRNLPYVVPVQEHADREGKRAPYGRRGVPDI